MTPSSSSVESLTFLEILSTNKNDTKCPDFIHVYVSHVKPSLCGQLVDTLSAFMSHFVNHEHLLPFPRLEHLRRVRRTILKRDMKISHSTSNESAISKSNGSIVHLEVLLSSVEYLDHLLSTSDEIRDQWKNIVSNYNLMVVKRIVPGRSAKSLRELNEWNSRRNEFEDELDHDPSDGDRVSWWPTLFFPEKTQEYILEKLELTEDEIQYMRNGMMEAVDDCRQHLALFSSAVPGAVIMSPISKSLVSISSQERMLQTQTTSNLDLLQVNPLCTPILLAIQGVSRKERLSIAETNVTMDHPTGQYICTGFDLFTTMEPSIYESMALVHSRIRRVVFGSVNTLDGGLGGTGLDHAIHSLPGTNHHYRVFRCNPELVDESHVL